MNSTEQIRTLPPECAFWPLPARVTATFSTTENDVHGERLSHLIAAVMRHAQSGELPLFAWTLGLPRDEWLRMINTLFPELEALTPPTMSEYAILRRGQPFEFNALIRLLLDGDVAQGTPGKADDRIWLTHAIASATQGERHLWQDLGLRRRDELNTLMREHFPLLHAAKNPSVHWKRFLYAELAVRLNQPDLQAPGCAACKQFRLCFPFPEKAGNVT